MFQCIFVFVCFGTRKYVRHALNLTREGLAAVTEAPRRAAWRAAADVSPNVFRLIQQVGQQFWGNLWGGTRCWRCPCSFCVFYENAT